jgi:hypothetical protein
MASWMVVLANGERACVRATGKADGDLRIDQPESVVGPRRQRIAPMPWVWLRQVHGPVVVPVDTEAAVVPSRGSEGDALVTTLPGVALSIQAADCAPVALVGTVRGVIGVAHVGWRGLETGVLPAIVDAMRARGETEILARIGPCISPGAYEFGEDDLDRLADRLGASVRARTVDGQPSLDLVAGVRGTLAGLGVTVVGEDPPCTSGNPALFYSHRARREIGRQALVAWKEPR